MLKRPWMHKLKIAAAMVVAGAAQAASGSTEPAAPSEPPAPPSPAVPRVPAAPALPKPPKASTLTSSVVIDRSTGSFTGNAGGFGIVLLTQGDPRNPAICEAFLAHGRLPHARAAREAPSQRVYRPVYWPVVSASLASSGQKDCATLLAEYDFTRANALRGGLRLDPHDTALAILQYDPATSSEPPRACIFDLAHASTPHVDDIYRLFAQFTLFDPGLWKGAYHSSTDLRAHLGRLWGAELPQQLVLRLR